MKRFKKYIQSKVYAPHFDIIRKEFGNAEFNLLDVGCGPNSVKIFKLLFPGIKYAGVDFNNSLITELIKSRMEHYYEINLEKTQLAEISESFYDCIVCSHVIEHLNNSLEVLQLLARKVKPGGYLFIEFPGRHSTKIISTKKLWFVKGTLNFYDDPTHVHVYDRKEIALLLQKSGFDIIKMGYRRNFFYLFLTPVILPYRFFLNKYFLRGSDLWDFTGFAEIVYAKRSL